MPSDRVWSSDMTCDTGATFHHEKPKLRVRDRARLYGHEGLGASHESGEFRLCRTQKPDFVSKARDETSN